MNYNSKNRRTGTILVHGLVAFIFLFVFSGTAFSENTDQLVLIHVKTIKTDKEFRLQSIAETTLAALKRGNRVIILFDGGAVRAIKIGRWYGGDTTILDKINLKDDQRRKLSNDLDISFASIPSNYGELFRLMRGRGVELYANKAVIKALRLKDGEYDMTFTPIGSDQMVDIFLNADVYISY